MKSPWSISVILSLSFRPVVMSKSITLKTEEIQDVEMVDEDDCSTSVFLSAQRETVNDKESTPPSTTKAKSETPAPSPTKQTKAGPQLIGHLPRAEEAALKVFERLDANHYQYSTLGRSREVMESMTCDCQYVPGPFFEHLLMLVYSS